MRYPQPLSRIVRLTVDDILTDPQGRVLIRLGDPPAPIPSPFDDIVRSHLRSRHNLDTATNPNSTWLFPGRRAGQPLRPNSIRRLTAATLAGGAYERRPAVIGGHVVDLDGAIVSQRAHARSLVQLCLQGVQFDDDLVGGRLRCHVFAVDQRKCLPAATGHDVHRATDDLTQRRSASD